MASNPNRRRRIGRRPRAAAGSPSLAADRACRDEERGCPSWLVLPSRLGVRRPRPAPDLRLAAADGGLLGLPSSRRHEFEVIADARQHHRRLDPEVLEQAIRDANPAGRIDHATRGLREEVPLEGQHVLVAEQRSPERRRELLEGPLRPEPQGVVRAGTAIKASPCRSGLSTPRISAGIAKRPLGSML